MRSAFSEVYNNASIPAGGSYFYPDFLICEKGLFIDVEIDEPYVGNDGTPIHYVDNQYGFCTSVDKERNDYITSQGFEIIRFSEEQIFLHPQECIIVIKDYISSILSGCQPNVKQKNSSGKMDQRTSFKMGLSTIPLYLCPSGVTEFNYE